MNTFLTIVLAALLTVFLAGVAIAEDRPCAPGGLALHQPSVTDSPGDNIASEVFTGGSGMSPAETLALNQPSITDSPGDNIASEVFTGGSSMSPGEALALNQPSITDSPSDNIAPEVYTGSTMYLACNQ